MSKLSDDQMFQLEDAIKNDPRFLSGGARRYFKRVWIGYFILAVAMVVGIWAFTNRADKNLRNDINRLNTISCISSIKIFTKYNDFVGEAIKTQKENLFLAKAQHDLRRIRIAKSAIQRYEKEKIVPPTPLQCKQPAIRP